MDRFEILGHDLHFKKLTDFVLESNTSGQYTHWYQVWADVKKVNDMLGVCGWAAKFEPLRNSAAYEDMQRILEGMSTLK